jgi:hypothetical protein
MLFGDEAPLRAPIGGVSTFAATFPQRGARDRHGRSLRDFDLETRLFKYPLSYAIDNAEFDAIPAPVRTRIYRRVYDALRGTAPVAGLDRFSADERRAAIEIVRDTKANVPAFWQPLPR